MKWNGQLDRAQITIVIPDDYQKAIAGLDCFRLLDGFNVRIYNDSASDISELVKRFEGADCIVLTRERTRITEELLSRLPEVKLISQTGKVSRHIDVDACTRRGVAITEGQGSSTAPAELTWTLIMAGMRKLVPAVNGMKAGKWQTNIGDRLESKTLGIWGYGKIGKRTAAYGKAFGMKVRVWGSMLSREKARQDGYLDAGSKEQFFSQSDVVTLHLRLKPETKGLISYDDLSLMKPGALFVNTSHAELIKQGALKRALENGRPGRAALDVFETEPVYDTNHWAVKMDNVLCTPHLGYVENQGYEYYFEEAFQNIVSFFEGQPENVHNPRALKA